jgi:hypothetical protein
MTRNATLRSTRNQPGQYLVTVDGYLVGDICSAEYMGSGPAWTFQPSIRGLTTTAHDTKREALECLRSSVDYLLPLIAEARAEDARWATSPNNPANQ